MSETSDALDRFEATYRVRYANQPRVSRDPEELERIVGELEGFAARGGADGERARQLHASYRAELEQIRAARAVPYAVPAARLRLWADLSRSRYRRGFAGRDRRTRDLGLLLEIVADLEQLSGAMRKLHQSAPAQNLASGADAGEELVRLYRAEVEQIRTSRRTGAQADQGSRLATLANEQFGRYARLFSGKSRVSRHPATLERILGSLREIAGEMRRLQAEGFDESNNNKNVTIVDGRIQAYTEELAQLRLARADVSVANRAGALGAAANDVFQAYRESFAGKKRADVDPNVLDLLFEDMWPIAKEMDEIDAKYDDDTNARNLQLVMDTLVLYAREYDAILAAKQPSP